MSKSFTLPAASVQVQDSQDQDDLHIVEYLNQDNLPELLRMMLSQASTPAELVPVIEMNCQKQMLFERLSTEFSHKELADEAVRQGVTKRTAERWTISWIEKGLIMKTSYGEYKKIA